MGRASNRCVEPSKNRTVTRISVESRLYISYHWISNVSPGLACPLSATSEYHSPYPLLPVLESTTAKAWVGLTELLVITWQMVGSPPPRFQLETVPLV